MKVCSTILLLYIFIPFTGSIAFSQDSQYFEEDLIKTEAYYKNTQSYSINTKYEYFENQNASKPIETLEGFIFKNNTNYFSKIGTTDFIYINDVFLKFDHAEKAVIYSKSEVKNSFMPIELSQMIANFDKIVASKNNEEIRFHLTFKKELNFPYKQMILVFNKKTFEIKRQEFFFKENQKFPGSFSSDKTINNAKMIISMVPSENDYSLSLVSLSNYISDPNNPKLTQKFGSYKLYNISQ